MSFAVVFATTAAAWLCTGCAMVCDRLGDLDLFFAGRFLFFTDAATEAFVDILEWEPSAEGSGDEAEECEVKASGDILGGDLSTDGINGGSAHPYGSVITAGGTNVRNC